MALAEDPDEGESEDEQLGALLQAALGEAAEAATTQEVKDAEEEVQCKTDSEEEDDDEDADKSKMHEEAIEDEDDEEAAFFVDIEGGPETTGATAGEEEEEEVFVPLPAEAAEHVLDPQGEALERCAAASGARLVPVAGSGAAASSRSCKGKAAPPRLVSVRGCKEAVAVARRLLLNLAAEAPEVVLAAKAQARGGRKRGQGEEPSAGAAGEKGICKWFAAGFCRNSSSQGCCRNGLHDTEAARQAEQAWLGQSPKAGALRAARLPLLLLLDLEGGGNTAGRDGEDEIIEVPVLAMCPVTGSEMGRFHRFTRPGYWTAQQGQMQQRFPRRCFNEGSTAVPFPQALLELQHWLAELLGKQASAISSEDFLFVTCGNWDVKTALPRQCGKPPPGGGVGMTTQRLLFSRWCNIKEAFREHFGLSQAAAPTGMRGMLRRLNIPLAGQHHLGMDDVSNLAKILSTLVLRGAKLEATGWAAGALGGPAQVAAAPPAQAVRCDKRPASPRCEELWSPTDQDSSCPQEPLSTPEPLPPGEDGPTPKVPRTAKGILAKYSSVQRAEAAGHDLRIKGQRVPGTSPSATGNPAAAGLGGKGGGKKGGRSRRRLPRF